MIMEITKKDYFQDRMQYVQDLVKQAEWAEQAQDVNKIKYLLDVLATEIAPFHGIEHRQVDQNTDDTMTKTQLKILFKNSR
jgi:negative regulator of replication initiation